MITFISRKLKALALRVAGFLSPVRERTYPSVEEALFRAERNDLGARPVTYAIGDVHGEITLLMRLLQLLPLHPQDTLVFLGDYLDKGEDSLATIRALRRLQRLHPSCVFLRGNHEDAWLECWNGSEFLGAPNMKSARRLWRANRRHMPAEIGYWLEETRLEYEDEFAYYVHAGVLPGLPFEETPAARKMWGPRGFLKSNYDWGKLVVFGHWKLTRPLVEPNKICVDTGAYRSGTLTAVRLPDRQIFQAQHISEATPHEEQKALHQRLLM